MKQTFAVFGLAAFALTGGPTMAQDVVDDRVTGSYILYQSDGFQRVLTFDDNGTVFQVSDQQKLIGFTSGQGSWELVGDAKVSAQIIDFAFDQDTGEPQGPSSIIYEITFSELQDGRYQSLTGQYSGKQFSAGEDPLDPTKAPTSTYGIDFTGKRIGAK